MIFSNKLTAPLIGLTVLSAGAAEAQSTWDYEQEYLNQNSQVPTPHLAFIKPITQSSSDLTIEYALVDEADGKSTFDYLIIRESRATQTWGVIGDIVLGRPNHQDTIDNSQDGFITFTEHFSWQDDKNMYHIEWLDFPEMNFTLNVYQKATGKCLYQNHFGNP